jgi:DNA (cytosine-5)-methyltransferase 1
MLIDNDAHICRTLSSNRPGWNVLQMDLRDFVGAEHQEVLGIDLMSGGVPCTPFSVAGRQRGAADQRDLMAVAIWLATEVRPRAILIENVPALLTNDKFAGSRNFVAEELTHLGYRFDWQILRSADFGVPQHRPHSILIAMRPEEFERFSWPEPSGFPPTVGEVLCASMASEVGRVLMPGPPTPTRSLRPSWAVPRPMAVRISGLLGRSGPEPAWG